MRSIHRHGLLSQALLMLGVVGLPPPPTREQLDAEALAEAERVKADLEAAGFSAAEVAETVGPERFTKVGRALLAIRKDRHLLGQEAKVSKTAYMGEREFDGLREEAAQMRLTTEIAKVDPLCLSAQETRAAVCAIPREPRTHNRKAQRAGKKARNAAKKRRGW